MALTPPSPISPVYTDNVDSLIQVLLQNINGVGMSVPALQAKEKIFTPTLFEILEKSKSIGAGNIQSDWLEANVLDGAYILNKPTLATVATSGLYTDLTGLPTLFTTSDARTAISLTTTGTTGASTYSNVTGVLNIPQYGGVTSLSNIGSSPNAQGATISGTALQLQPASSTFGGIITTGNQTISGVKSFIAQHTIYTDSSNGWYGYIGGIATGIDYFTIGISRSPTTGIFPNTSVAAAQINLESSTGKGEVVIYTTDVNNTVPLCRFRISNIGNCGISDMASLPSNNFIFMDNSAVLDLNSVTRGFLPPRMTEVERDAIVSAADGLIVFCTDCIADNSNLGVSQTYSSGIWNNHY